MKDDGGQVSFARTRSYSTCDRCKGRTACPAPDNKVLEEEEYICKWRKGWRRRIKKYQMI
jgi:hypothetical protein